MIEFRPKHDDSIVWIEWNADFPKHNKLNFRFYDFRINGVVYTEYTESFREIYENNEIVFWSKLCQST